MDNRHYVSQCVLPAALTLLPSKMNAEGAARLMLAIGLQESNLDHRAQVKGPARGFWQFEAGGGVRGVMTHQATAGLIRDTLKVMSYDPESHFSVHHQNLAHNDILAAVFARLLLWTDPGPLPTEDDVEGSWQYYIDNWRPGKPHRDRWDANFAEAILLTTPDRKVPRKRKT